MLVATDVAARGLNIDALPIVVNYELPHTAHDYVHRIGRTGRAGAAGQAVLLVAPEEEDYLKAVNRLLKRDLPVRIVKGFEPTPGSQRRPWPDQLSLIEFCNAAASARPAFERGPGGFRARSLRGVPLKLEDDALIGDTRLPPSSA